MKCHECGGTYHLSVGPFKIDSPLAGALVVPDIQMLVCDVCEDQLLDAEDAGVVGAFVQEKENYCRKYAPTKPGFKKDLEALINRYSLESESDTPDFILAEYMSDCLQAFNKATTRRAEWYTEG